MNSSQNGKDSLKLSGRRRNVGQRLFARYGTAAILITVLLVVVAWTGFLGWILVLLFQRLTS